MTLHEGIDPLLAYTDWQRQLWHTWFAQAGPGPLAISTGPHGDGRFPTVGGLVHHIFSAELRYVDRLRQQPVADTTNTPTDVVAPLFELGTRSRQAFMVLLRDLTAERWDTSIEFSLFTSRIRTTPRKVIYHVLTHEVRHWAQVATYLRMSGHKLAFQDFLFSPVFGDPIRL